MKVFVLCGGRGTRLRPYTNILPKPMLPVGGLPILEYVIGNLKRNGFDDFVFTIGYKGEVIKEYFGNGEKWGVSIEYLEEDPSNPKNTAGSILPYKGKLDDDFLVVMGDQITNLNYMEMVEAHKKSGAIATIAFIEKKEAIEYGIAEIEGGYVRKFLEKPINVYYINTANYVFKPEIFDYIKEKEDFGKDVLPRLVERGERIHAYISRDFWIDIGRIKDYEEVNRYFSIVKVAKDILGAR